MRNISKAIFLNTLVCTRLGWLLRNESRAEQLSGKELTLGEKFRIDQGIAVGRRARKIFSNGKLIDDINLELAASNTSRALKDSNISIIFEGTFLVDSFVAKADIIKRNPKGWHLIEVKSNLNNKSEFIDDMAYTAMVMDKSGIKLNYLSLFLISKEFRLGMSNEELFVELDQTKDVENRAEEFKPYWQHVNEMTGLSEKPESNLIFNCKKCMLFEKCLGKDFDNHIFEIPRLSKSKFDKLVESNIFSIENIPDNFPLTENQEKIRYAVKNKVPYISESLEKKLIKNIFWPAYYLDFETVMTVIPLYSDIAPYTQLPTQYSIHKCTSLGIIENHFEYLADPSKDSRREIAENLINDLNNEGSIIIYSNFEKTIVNSLIREFYDIADDLKKIIDRMVDLEKIIRKNFYHPGFHGSTSIKKTLPVIVPDMSYDEFSISEGDSAMAAFAYLAQGKYNNKEAEKIKKDLLTYCKQDTLAMVKLHEKLLSFVR